MNERVWPVLLISLFVGGFYLQRPALPSGQPAGPAAGRAAAQDSASGLADDDDLREPMRLVREFFGVRSPERLPAAVAGGAGNLSVELSAAGDKVRFELPLLRGAEPPGAAAARSSSYAQYDLEYLIALVPDPLDSQLPANFDLTVDAIQASLGEGGYLPDRLWLPWRAPAAATSRLYQRSPGLMLFRKPSAIEGVRRLKLVFLVGETQKIGIHKRAFLAAMAMIEKLPRAKGAQADTVEILGPAFSGSAESLRITLELWRRRGQAPAAPPGGPEAPVVAPASPPIRVALTPPASSGVAALAVASGSPAHAHGLESEVEALPAVNRSSAQAPNLASGAEPLPAAGGSPALTQAPAGQAAWHPSFRIITGSATARNLEDLRRPDVVFDRALVSDDMLIDHEFPALVRGLGWDLDKVALLVEGDTEYGRTFIDHIDQNAAAGKRHFLHARFPSRVSGFRTAREQDGKRAAPQGKDPLEVRRTELDLSLADHGEPIDLVPDFSPDSSRSTELAIANLMEQVRRRGVRYVGIVATDVKDTLFLAEKVHGAVPHAVRFTFDSNLLEAHPQFSNAMNGLLVFSSVPLCHEEVPGGSHQLMQFASEAQQGVFLAVQRLLDRPAVEKHIWMSVVGNGSLWPLARVRVPEPAPSSARADLQVTADLAETAANAGVVERGASPIGWLAVGVVLLLLAEWLNRTAGGRQNLGTAGLAASCGYAVLWGTGALLLAAYALPLWLSKEDAWDFLGAPRFQVGLAALGTLYAYLVWRFAASTPQLDRWRWPGTSYLPWALPGLAVLALAGYGISWLWVPGGWDNAGFLYHRLAHPASGLSPLLPVLCFATALFAAALLEVKRRVMDARHGTDWPLPLRNWPGGQQPEPQLDDAALLAGQVTRRLELHRGGNWLLAAAVVGLVLLSRLFVYLQPIAEPRQAGLVFLLLLATASAFAARSLFRFARLWRALTQVLDRLCYTWLLPALRSEAATVQWNPLKSFGWRLPSFKMAMIAVDKLKELARLAPLGPEGGQVAELVQGSLADTEKDLGRALLADRNGDLGQEIASREALSARLTGLTRDLEARRIGFGGSTLPAELLAPKAPPRPLPSPQQVIGAVEQFLALRVVAYVRYVFAHLRYDLLGAIVPGLFLLLGVSLYAFEPKQLYSLGVWASLLAASAVTLWSFAQMDRDAALSAMGGTDAGKVSFNRTFWINVFSYGVIPVLGVLVTQFPQIGQLFVGWAEPVLRAVSSK